MRKTFQAIMLVLFSGLLFANNLAFARLKYDGGNWDTRVTAWGEIADFLVSISNVRAVREPLAISPESPELFNYPVVFMTGDAAFFEWKPAVIERLKKYFDAGGILIIDDSTGVKDSAFAGSVRRELAKIFPNEPLERIKESNAIFLSFFLMPKVCGVRQAAPYLEGVERSGQLSVIFSANDMFGTWEKDKLGNWLRDCRPGGEAQRLEAQKLSVNIIMYAMVGTYKLDAIHTDYIRQKMNTLNMKIPGQAK